MRFAKLKATGNGVRSGRAGSGNQHATDLERVTASRARRKILLRSEDKMCCKEHIKKNPYLSSVLR